LTYFANMPVKEEVMDDRDTSTFITPSWSDQPHKAHVLHYDYRDITKEGYDLIPSLQLFNADVREEFFKAMSQHGEEWFKVKRFMHKKGFSHITTRHLQDFFYSTWCTTEFGVQRKAADKAYFAVCRQEEALKAKEKARAAAEKKRLQREKVKQEKEARERDAAQQQEGRSHGSSSSSASSNQNVPAPIIGGNESTLMEGEYHRNGNGSNTLPSTQKNEQNELRNDAYILSQISSDPAVLEDTALQQNSANGERIDL